MSWDSPLDASVPNRALIDVEEMTPFHVGFSCKVGPLATHRTGVLHYWLRRPLVRLHPPSMPNRAGIEVKQFPPLCFDFAREVHGLSAGLADMLTRKDSHLCVALRAVPGSGVAAGEDHEDRHEDREEYNQQVSHSLLSLSSYFS